MPVTPRSDACAYRACQHLRDPLQTLDWGTLSPQDWWLPKDALSLHGVAEFESVPEIVQKRLSH